MIPDDRFYTREHLWVRPEESQAAVGLTRPLLLKLGSIIAIELLDPDDETKIELPFGELECVNETVQLYPPIEARITEVNDELIWRHDKIAEDPYGEGWLVRLRLVDQRELRMFMTASIYEKYCREKLGDEYLDG